MDLENMPAAELRDLAELVLAEIDVRFVEGENFVVPLPDGRVLLWRHKNCDEGKCSCART